MTTAVLSDYYRDLALQEALAESRARLKPIVALLTAIAARETAERVRQETAK